MSGSTFTVTHHAVSSETGRTADGNGSHGSTSKAPSYTKSVSWEHYPSAEYKKSDNELNNTYQQVLKATSGEQTNLLKKSQNKWIEYRDTDCKFQTYSSRDGSINSMNVSHCLTGKTEQRTKELKEMLNCPEGDVSCAL